MNIEIHQPELEALIQQRMASGASHDVGDALIQTPQAATNFKRQRRDNIPA